MMILTFGSHRGESVEEVVLRDPNYVAWMLNLNELSATMEKVCEEARRLIGVFNNKPFVAKCRGCKSLATRATAYIGPNLDLVFWCDQCDPYWGGASHGKLEVIGTYGAAIQHASFGAGGRKGDSAILIRNLARAKGLPERARATDIGAFFDG